MNFYEQREANAIAKLKELLALPPIPGGTELYSDGECFDPWDMFPALYGSYSSEFDELALDVLKDIRDCSVRREDLATQMFREILCTTGLCDYGTSPRVCFATGPFKEVLPTLIERWNEYASLKWNDNV